MHDDPPKRWLEDAEAPEGFADLVSEVRQQLPSEARHERIAAQLGTLMDAPLPPAFGSGSSGGASGGASVGLSSAAIWGGSALMLAVLGGAIAIYSYSPPSPDTPPPAPVEREPRPHSEPPTAPILEPVPAQPNDSSNTPDPSEAIGSPSARPALPSEASLIGDAQRSLRSDPAATLRLTVRHRRYYRRGRMMQERELLAIEALLGLGQVYRARNRAERFLRRFPQSAHSRRVQSLLQTP